MQQRNTLKLNETYECKFNPSTTFYELSENRFISALEFVLGHNFEHRVSPIEIVQALLNSPEFGFYHYDYDLYQILIHTNNYDVIKLLMDYGIQLDESETTLRWSELQKSHTQNLSFDTVQLLMHFPGDLSYKSLSKIFSSKLNVLARVGIVNELIYAQMLKELLCLLKTQEKESKNDLPKQLEAKLEKLFDLKTDTQNKEALVKTFVLPVIEFAKNLTEVKTLGEIKEDHFEESLKSSKLSPSALLTDKHHLENSLTPQTALEYYISTDRLMEAQILLMYATVREQETTESNAIKKAIYHKNLKGLYLLITQIDIKNPLAIFLHALDVKNYQNPQNQFAVLTVLLKRMEIRHAIPDPVYITIIKDYFYRLSKQSLHVLFKFLRPSIPFMVNDFNQWYQNLYKQNPVDNQQLKQALSKYIDINHQLPNPYSVIVSNWMFAYCLQQNQMQYLPEKEAKRNTLTNEEYKLVSSEQYWFAEYFNRHGQEFKFAASQLYNRAADSLMSIKSNSFNALDFINPIYYLRRAIKEAAPSNKVDLFKNLFKLYKKWFIHYGPIQEKFPLTIDETKNDLHHTFECFGEIKVEDAEWRSLLQYSFVASKIFQNSPSSHPALTDICYIGLCCFEKIKEPTEQDKKAKIRLKESFIFNIGNLDEKSPYFIPHYQKAINLIEEEKLHDQLSLGFLTGSKLSLFIIYRKFSLKTLDELVNLAQEIIKIIETVIKKYPILRVKLNPISIYCHDEICVLYHNIPSYQDKFYENLAKKIELLEQEPKNELTDLKLATSHANMGKFFRESDRQKAKHHLLTAIKLVDFQNLTGKELTNYIEWVLIFSDFYAKKLLIETQDQTLRLTQIFKHTRHIMVQHSMGEKTYQELNIKIHQHLIETLNNLTHFVKPDTHAKTRLAKVHCSLGDFLFKEPLEANFHYEKALDSLLTVNKLAIRDEIAEYVSIQDKLCYKFINKFQIEFFECEDKTKNESLSDKSISKAYEFALICYTEANYLFKNQHKYPANCLNELYKSKCIGEFYLSALAYCKNDLGSAQKYALAFQTTYDQFIKKLNKLPDQFASHFFTLTELQKIITKFLKSIIPTIEPTHKKSSSRSEFTLEEEPPTEVKHELTPEELERIKKEDEEKRIAAEEQERKQLAQKIIHERLFLQNKLADSIYHLKQTKNQIIDKLIGIKNLLPKRLEIIRGRNTTQDNELAHELELELVEYDHSLTNLENNISMVSEVKTDDLEKLQQTIEKTISFIKDARVLLDESLPDFNLKTKDAAAPKDEIKRVDRTEQVRAFNQNRQNKRKEKKALLDELKVAAKLKREEHKLNRQHLIEESKHSESPNIETTSVEVKTPTSIQQTTDVALFWERAISTVVNMQQLLEISRESKKAAVIPIPGIPGNQEMIIHFALLYNILQFSRFRYRKNDMEKDQLVDLRNMLIHHGAFQLADFKVYGQTVLDAANSFCPSLREDIEVYFNKRRGFVSQPVKEKEIQFELQQLSKKGSFPDVELVNFLQKFHLEDRSVTSYSDMTEKNRKSKVFLLIPYIQSIYQVIKEVKELTESHELQNRFMPHIQALKMLFTLCGEIHPIPKSRVDCKNDYIRFCARCKVIRNWEAHEFKEFSLKDVLKTAEIVEKWKLRPVTVANPVINLVPSGFTYDNAAVLFSPAATGAGPGPNQSPLLNVASH